MSWIAFVPTTLIGWYLINAFEFALNSGQLGRSRWWVFKCFWEELLENIPGRFERKIARLRTMIGVTGSSTFYSHVTKSVWWSEDLRQDTSETRTVLEGLAHSMFASVWYFWLVQVGLYLILGIVVGLVALPFLLIMLLGKSIKAVARTPTVARK